MTNPNYTHLAFIVDRSGSMANIAQDMNGGITTLIAEQAKLPGELHIDITTFDTVVERPYVDARPDDVKGEIIVPRGGTALNDAVGKTVTELGERFAGMPEDDRPGKVIIAIVTDGYENSSREWEIEAVKALVEKQRDQFQWEFLFFGADSIDAFDASAGYGIGRGQTISFSNTSAGAKGATFAASSYMTASRAGDTRDFTEEERLQAEGK